MSVEVCPVLRLAVTGSVVVFIVVLSAAVPVFSLSVLLKRVVLKRTNAGSGGQISTLPCEWGAYVVINMQM